MKNIVEVSLDHAFKGLYLSPDMRFYGATVTSSRLHEPVRAIHRQQPLAAHYADFADAVYEAYSDDAVVENNLMIPLLMTMSSFSVSHEYLNRVVWSICEVAASLYYRDRGVVETASIPRLIPFGLDDIRIERPWEIQPTVFQRILRKEPWLSWSERMRAEQQRIGQVMRHPDLDATLERFWKEVHSREAESEANTAAETPSQRRRLDKVLWHLEQRTRRSIKRAVKLHERFGSLPMLRRFVNDMDIMIKGAAYDYRVYKTNSLFATTNARNTGMSPVGMTIVSKAGEDLCTGCLVFRDVSVLDYLFHLRLVAGHPEKEQEMLRTTHVTSVTSAFFSDPLHLTKGIFDPYTAPLHTIHNVLAFSVDSDHYKARTNFAELWHEMAQGAVLEAIGVSHDYLEVLIICDAQDITNENFLECFRLAKAWFNPPQPRLTISPFMASRGVFADWQEVRKGFVAAA